MDDRRWSVKAMAGAIDRIYDEPLMEYERIWYNSMYFAVDENHRWVIRQNIIVVCEMQDTIYIDTGWYHTVWIARAINWYLKECCEWLRFSSYGCWGIDWSIDYTIKREEELFIDWVKVEHDTATAMLGWRERWQMVIERDDFPWTYKISYQ